MTDYDELLADAKRRLSAIRSMSGEGTADLVADLAAALRATLAAQPQPDEPRCGDCGGPIDTNGLCLNLDIARPTGDDQSEHDEALAVVVGIAFDWAGEYGFGSPAAARRAWEAARLLRPDLEPTAPATPTGDDDA